MARDVLSTFCKKIGKDTINDEKSTIDEKLISAIMIIVMEGNIILENSLKKEVVNQFIKNASDEEIETLKKTIEIFIKYAELSEETISQEGGK